MSPNPILAACLNLVCCQGGLGYLYLRQFRKAAISLGITVGVALVDQLTYVSWHPPALLLSFFALTLVVLTTFDAANVARLRRAGHAVGPREVTLPALRWLGPLYRPPNE